MFEIDILKSQLSKNGFIIIENILSYDKIEEVISKINPTNTSNPSFRKSSDLYAIRQFLKAIPEVADLVLNNKLITIIEQLFGEGYFLTRSIYFDKPESSNWFVAWHQDLTISTDKKLEINNYGPWTIKQNQYGVQPPVEILESNFTVRIHLDDTNETNGALKVIPGSHLKGIYRPEIIDWSKETETICNVPKGGIMIMRPLLLHSSARSGSGMRRRVIHLEFSNQKLAEGLNWVEYRDLKKKTY